MKLIGTLLLTLIIFSCGNSSEKKVAKEKKVKYERYYDHDNGFVIEYPKSWIKIDTISEPSTILVVRENNSDTSDVFTESMSLRKVPNEGKNLEQIIAENLETLNKYRPDYKISHGEFISENGIKTRLIKTGYEEQGIDLRTMSIFFIKDSDLFMITQTLESSKEEEYKLIFGHALNSFEWIEE